MRTPTPARLLALLATLAALLLLPVAAGAADAPPAPPHGPHGFVAAAGPGPAGRPSSPFASAVQIEAAGASTSSGNLTYHGGPVMHSTTTYTIFWSPGGAIPASYESLINQYFADVAHDSGGATNVYATDPQYTDGSGTAAYSSTVGGTWVDTSTAIPDNCSSEYSTTSVRVSGCVLDTDLQAEVSRALAANGWTADASKIFFVFTPRNVGSCVDSSTKSCAYTTYCAYHSDFTASGKSVLYTNQPYTDTSGVGAPGVCDSGQQPNGSWADATVNVVSHEHNEAATDPLITAWYDSAGYENGDKCAWTFGTTLGGSPGSGGVQGTEWNQLINGHHYFLQQEWNNASSGCVQWLTAPSVTPPPAAPSISGFSPASGGVGTTVTIGGSNLTGATAVKFNGTSATFTVASSSSITATVPAGATSGTVSVTTPGGAATSSSSFTVLPAPALGSFSPTSGAAGTSVTISGSNFTGATAVTFNGTPATFTVSKTTSISTKVPAGATTGPITVTTPGGTATSSASFTVPVPPTISAFTPASAAAGNAVTISGANFTGATSVKFNGTPASFTVTNATTVSARVPSGATTGPITVTTSAGTGTSPTSFTFIPPDFTIAVSPASQTVARGSSVSFTITITRLNGFTGSVSLSVSGLVGGSYAPSASFSSSTISSSSTSSVLKISTRSTTATSSTTLTITGASGSLKHTASAGLTVT